ncbi:MAG: UDP-N-acetylglucosamine--N-acetylmuramyl-(pentapeptide) pyrophosphoryl-undecaprenol N-acetylglucosamine transferase [Elusimicrobia bacterium]|nr:UDP-N-acetylglucosamine--N-acetylmuramyl-(pentapeptide) pyrophosphoryl-undecaprenol N-acetylglucosamine transferase [Elusimicrobiota bacterium]
MLLAVGLTGGHIYPAVALAEELGREGFEYLFVARSGSILAQKILEQEGWPVVYLDVQGLPRSAAFLWKFPVFLLKQWEAFLLCRRVIADWKPDLAAGFGGYVSFPVMAAARLRGTAVLLFEPNAALGLANQAARFFADKIAFCMTPGGVPKSVEVEPPLRASLKGARDIPGAQAKQRWGLRKDSACVLIFGGSQGSRIINREAARTVADLKAAGAAFSFIHVTGAADHPETSSFYRGLGLSPQEALCLEYCQEMGLAYRAADIVVSRAGAMTCLELFYFAKRCILIPFEKSAGAHQRRNARYLESFGIARIIAERGLAGSLGVVLQEELRRHRGASKPEAAALRKTPTLGDVARQLMDKKNLKK